MNEWKSLEGEEASIRADRMRAVYEKAKQLGVTPERSKTMFTITYGFDSYVKMPFAVRCCDQCRIVYNKNTNDVLFVANTMYKPSDEELVDRVEKTQPTTTPTNGMMTSSWYDSFGEGL